MTLPNFIEKAYAQATKVNLLVPSIGGNKDGVVDPAKGLEGYISTIFPLMIQLGVAIAILTMVYWGLRKITSEVPGLKAEGNERMTNALIGLGLLLVAYLILNTINPKILTTTLNSISGTTK